MANDEVQREPKSAIFDDLGVIAQPLLNALLNGRDIIMGRVGKGVAQRWANERASSQIRGTGEPGQEYDDRRQATWSRGVQSGSIFPEGAGAQPEYPYQNGPWSRSQAGLQSHDTGGGQDYYHDLIPQPMRKIRPQGTQQDRKSVQREVGNIEDPFDGTQYNAVPFLHQDGLGAMAGPRAFSSQQYASGHVASGGLVVSPPGVDGNAGNTTRSLSDILGKVQGRAAAALPAIFTPREVQ